MLNDMLHVPHIKRNLISIARLTASNNLYLEFHSNFCLLKDKDTRKVMLHGAFNNGLYQIKLPPLKDGLESPFNSKSKVSSIKVALGSTSQSVSSLSIVLNVEKSRSCKVSKTIWHQRLGHPSKRVVSIFLNSCNLKFPLNEKVDFCDAC